MSIIDKDNLLSHHEIQAYMSLLANHGYKPNEFHIEVTEDQDEIDMGDLNYVVMIYVKVKHMPSNTSKVYSSKQNSGLWTQELEEDLDAGLYK